MMITDHYCKTCPDKRSGCIASLMIMSWLPLSDTFTFFCLHSAPLWTRCGPHLTFQAVLPESISWDSVWNQHGTNEIAALERRFHESVWLYSRDVSPSIWCKLRTQRMSRVLRMYVRVAWIHLHRHTHTRAHTHSMRLKHRACLIAIDVLFGLFSLTVI